jgi:hypothetical protein
MTGYGKPPKVAAGNGGAKGPKSPSAPQPKVTGRKGGK